VIMSKKADEVAVEAETVTAENAENSENSEK
jgi:hypothetical protein